MTVPGTTVIMAVHPAQQSSSYLSTIGKGLVVSHVLAVLHAGAVLHAVHVPLGEGGSRGGAQPAGGALLGWGRRMQLRGGEQQPLGDWTAGSYTGPLPGLGQLHPALPP